MFVAGELVSLEPISIENIPENPKIGDTFTQHYRYKDIVFRFFNTVDYVCPEGSVGGCEVTNFKTELKTNKAGKVATEQLFGDCGC